MYAGQHDELNFCFHQYLLIGQSLLNTGLPLIVQESFVGFSQVTLKNLAVPEPSSHLDRGGSFFDYSCHKGTEKEGGEAV